MRTSAPTTVRIFLCALCDSRGTLLRLKPSTFYACQRCVTGYGSRDATLLALIETLKWKCMQNDQRLNSSAVLSEIRRLAKAMHLPTKEAVKP